MKYPYILYHISNRLHTLVRGYSGPGYSEETLYGKIVEFSDEHVGSRIRQCRAICSYRGSVPLILSVSSQFAYGWVVQRKARYLIGPVRFEEEMFFSTVISPDDLDLPKDSLRKEWIQSIPLCSFQEFASDILLLHNCRKTAEEVDSFLKISKLFEANCLPENPQHRSREDMTGLLFENRELGFVHNPYNHEARERASIQNGDVEALRKVLEEDFTGRYGILSRNPLRQEINMGIVTTTIATRAAIDGGLHPETAFYISDITIQQMEASKNIASVKSIYRNAEIYLAELVRDVRAEKEGEVPVRENRHISHCKDYIFTHLHDKLTVSGIARAIGLDANYLSALFKKCEHVTLKQYILNEKIKLVKNLLIYSSYSYSKIAVYLGFASQSHLGAEFRKVTGMTLRQYREANAREDFVYDQMFRDQT